MTITEVQLEKKLEKAIANNGTKIAKALTQIHGVTKAGTDHEKVDSFFKCSENEKFNIICHNAAELWTVAPQTVEDFYFVAYTLNILDDTIKNELKKSIPAMFQMMANLACKEYITTRNDEELENYEDIKSVIESWKTIIYICNNCFENTEIKFSKALKLRK